MKLKIVSDGTAYGTKITDENGEPVENITAVEIRWRCDAEKNLAARATIDVFLSACDIQVEGEGRIISTETKTLVSGQEEHGE